MGQLPTKIISLACNYDFSVDGSAQVPVDMRLNIQGGQSITSCRYTVISALTHAGAATNVDAGFYWGGSQGIIDVAHTIAVLNAGIGTWFTSSSLFIAKWPIGNTFNQDIGFKVVGGADALTGGVMLFNFTVVQNSM